LLNRFSKGLLGDAVEEDSSRGKFLGLDELRGPPYSVLASFRATVLYPYDVALAIFYELYSMGMPLLMPDRRLLQFYVFRGLHSYHTYHFVRPNGGGQNLSFPGAGIGSPPFVPPLDAQKWWSVGSAWSARTDFDTFPHILRFSTVAELFAHLAPGATDWAEVSRNMRRFNQVGLVETSARWAFGLTSALAGTAG
ncbi:unnamed protein product, partial [Polarella glacialis]